MIFLLLFVAVLIFAFVYCSGIYNERYWKKRGVAFYEKNKVLGIFWDFFTKDKALFEHFHDLYKEYSNAPAVGIGSILTPALYVRDPLNIQHIFATNFKAFNHRGLVGNEGDLLADNILFQNGAKWKLMRQSMSPLFTAAKLRSMYYIMDRSAQDFVTYLRENPKLMQGDTFTTLSRFCNAAISAAVFGLSTQSIFDSPFLKMAQDASTLGFVKNLKFALGNLSEFLFKIFKIKLFKEHEDFFIGAIKQIVRQREIDTAKRHDFADICISLQNKGILKDSTTGLELKPTNELLAAQAFFFYIAGVEPTASSMFATLVELGKSPEHLQRLHKEIDETFDTHDGNLTYDIVDNMTFLDMAMSEAMRLHPPIGFLTRKCIQDTILPAGNIKVSKGTKIFTPIFELHHDPKYYPEPEVFNPERFSRENSNAIADMTYMPFGGGNRICIGMRYAQLQAKSGLVHLLRNFTIKTHTCKGKKYRKEQVFVRIANMDVEFVPIDK